MKIKDIEIGKSYTDKDNNSIRKVIFIKDKDIKYILINGRYKSKIGKEYCWYLDKFAQWASSFCNETDKLFGIEKFFKNPTAGVMLRLKDEFTLEDFFKIDGIDSKDIVNFNVDDFKQVKIGEFSSFEYDEYDILVKSKDKHYYSFPCSREEVEKYFEFI